ncbi:MAG TPA: hypothetical protein VFM82_07330 [Flavobacteriaceae bacterium]|nr:hypothetical protein [Flavobacteriaceae bacterium]
MNSTGDQKIGDSIQLGLFQNMELHAAYTCFNELHLKKAIFLFKKALDGFCPDPEQIRANIEFCEYWIPLMEAGEVPSLLEIGNREVCFSNFLTAFRDYSFSKEKKPMRGKLLGFLTEKIYLENHLGIGQNLAELLIEHKEYHLASRLLKKLTKENRTEYALFYKLGEAQCLEGNKTGSRKSYARAMLFFPKASFDHYIKDDKLLKIINAVGMELTPAYGRIYGLLPVVKIGDLKPTGQIHAHALKSYDLLDRIYRAGKNNLEERRELKNFNPELFGAYLKNV